MSSFQLSPHVQERRSEAVHRRLRLLRHHGMCSVCYKKHHGIVDGGGGSGACASTVTASKPVTRPARAASSAAVSTEAAKKVEPNRCPACYKKVGLAGFLCRCGKTSCGRHRYAEEHGCAFDLRL